MLDTQLFLYYLQGTTNAFLRQGCRWDLVVEMETHTVMSQAIKKFPFLWGAIFHIKVLAHSVALILKTYEPVVMDRYMTI